MKRIDLDDVDANRAIDIAQEATTLATLTHPNIIKYYDSFRDDEFFYIITEFCEVHYISNEFKVHYIKTLSLAVVVE